MIPGQFDYVRPASLDDALRILQDREGEAKLLSGGYSLLPLIKLRLAQPALLVDLQDISGLDGVRETDDHLVIGARATHRQVHDAAPVQDHYPGIVDRMPPGSFDLVLSGHLHAGQICLPWPGRRVTLAHPRARVVAGLYKTAAGVMHVSPGTGTTFIPFRFFARPEVTELVVRRQASVEVETPPVPARDGGARAIAAGSLISHARIRQLR